MVQYMVPHGLVYSSSVVTDGCRWMLIDTDGLIYGCGWQIYVEMMVQCWLMVAKCWLMMVDVS